MTKKRSMTGGLLRVIVGGFFLWTLQAAAAIGEPLPGVGTALPDGWICRLADSSDSTVWPRGIFRPAFTLVFTDTVHSIRDCARDPFHPNLTLCFYPDSLRDTIERIIDAQKIYSWCVPIKYFENNTYFIVTSPCFINNGCFSNEAAEDKSPLDAAIHAYLSTTRAIVPAVRRSHPSSRVTPQKAHARCLVNGRAVARKTEHLRPAASSVVIDEKEVKAAVRK
jgi:hypothetical protein